MIVCGRCRKSARFRQANQRWGGFAEPQHSSSAPDWRSSQEAQHQRGYYGDTEEPQMGRRRDSWDTGTDRASRYRDDVAGAGGGVEGSGGDRVPGGIGRGNGAGAEFELAQLGVARSREVRLGALGIEEERAPEHQTWGQSRGTLEGELVDTPTSGFGHASFERPLATQAPTNNEQQLIDISDFEPIPAPSATDWGHSNLGYSQDTTGATRSQLPTIPPPPPPRPRGAENTNPFKLPQ